MLTTPEVQGAAARVAGDGAMSFCERKMGTRKRRAQSCCDLTMSLYS